MGDAALVPHDGWHGALPRGGSLQDDGELVDPFQRFATYGNWAGPGDRLVAEPGYIAAQRAANPAYDPHADPHFAAIDGLDDAARLHDIGYQKLGNDSAFSWNGLRKVQGDDRRLVDAVGGEMTTNGAQYSDTAQTYANGLRGFFGGRTAGLDAVDWAGAKIGEAAAGLGGLVTDRPGWGGLGERLGGAGRWLASTGREAAGGISRGVHAAGDLGVVGSIAAAAGLGNVAVSGAGHALSRLYDWIAD